ncbi:hypothetical protein [Telmatospirillum sp. J64-1]|uniref:hypothetical protein n=1 Tax=Telmatospirillum sp. J64-1 TaxID=2502183 RepID=UPI00115DD20F|nr:hypothetical protein [Telmatospirillum sp. J64-1]
MKKNPMMSLWLSGANQAFSAGRGLWMAEFYRQQNLMMNEMTKQMLQFWTGAWMLPPERKTGKDKRR